MKLLSAVAVTLIVAINVAFAQPAAVKVTDLGTPSCADKNPEPKWTNGWYINNLHGNEDAFVDPWSRWTVFAGHSFYSVVFQINGATVTPSTALWRYPTKQNSVTLILGNPQLADKMRFWVGQKVVAEATGAEVVAAVGPALDNDYYVELTPAVAFDSFSLSVEGKDYSYLAFANLDADCH